MLCCSSECDRKEQCALYYLHPQPEHRKYDNLESLATYGWGKIGIDGCENYYDCGPLGDYKMFTPLVQSKTYIEKESLLAYLEDMGVSKSIVDTINQEDRFPTVGAVHFKSDDFLKYCDPTTLTFKTEE